MWGSALLDYERAALMYPCHRYVEKLGTRRDAMSADIAGAWMKWKLRQADNNGLIKVGGGPGGLLGGIPETLVPLAELMPWECAGPFIQDPIDLAFKLWVDNDQHFSALLLKHGIGDVFALIGIVFQKQAQAGSLIRLNQFLVQDLVFELQLHERAATLTEAEMKIRTAKARANKDKEKTVQRHQAIFTAAVDCWCRNFHLSRDEVVARLQEDTAKGLKVKTVKKLIAGAKTVAKQKRRAEKTDLYATVQKSNW